MLENNEAGNTNLVKIATSFSTAGKTVDEVVVLFYANEMIKAMSSLHSNGIIGANFFPENIFLRDKYFFFLFKINKQIINL